MHGCAFGQWTGRIVSHDPFKFPCHMQSDFALCLYLMIQMSMRLTGSAGGEVMRNGKSIAALGLLAAAQLTISAATSWGATTVSDVFGKAGEISFCSELADPPAAYLATDGTTPEGFEVDIMQAIGQALGVRADIRNYKFAAIFAALDSGKCDAVMSQTSKSPERLQKYIFIDIRQQGSGLLVKAGNPL